ncbi:MAG: radical SAM protein [Deltaproteobacteria bacterium]|nr:radical SAM protein [Deltaproteobacteria bacterium]
MSRKAGDRRTELLSAETGTIRKKWAGRISVALTYPNYYRLGMSNLGFQTVYRLINDLEDVVCERVFLPEQSTKRRNSIRSLESGRPLVDFDIIAFSIAFENDYPHLLTILAEAGLPLWASERNTPHPLIIAGGVTSLLNPEPIAPFVNCFLIGEAEAILPAFFDVYKEHACKEDVLEALAREVPGTYVPALYRVSYAPDGTIAEFLPEDDFPARIQRPFVRDLSSCDTRSTILTPNTTFDNTCLIEAGRGCPHGCRFCAAGFVYRPPRFRSRTNLEKSLREAALRAKKIGLVAAAVSDVPDIASICRSALDANVQLSFSSLRADGLRPEFLEILNQTGVKTATIAPDGGSERMRRVINKGISEDTLLTAVEFLVRAGIPNIKLYFMVGLPTETMADVEAVVTLCKKVKHRFLKASRKRQKIGRITVSLNSFIPKPFTPFQWVPFEDINILKAKIKHVKDGLRRVANVQVHADIPRWAYIQALLSRGDRRTADLLVAAHENSGNWARILKESVLNPDFYVYRERSFDEVLPWDFIDHGIKKSYLISEYRKSLRAETTPPCAAGRCTACGVCKKDVFPGSASVL